MACWRYLQILKSVEYAMSRSKTIKLWTTCCFFLLMQACATAPERYKDAAVQPGVASAEHALELDGLSRGDRVVFYTGILANMGQVMIGRDYHSANGRACKRILNIHGDQLLCVACKIDNERWYMRKPLQAETGGITDFRVSPETD